jgi:hypothetical protein
MVEDRSSRAVIDIDFSAGAVACLPVPRAKAFSSFPLFAWWPPLLFLVRNILLKMYRGIIRLRLTDLVTCLCGQIRVNFFAPPSTGMHIVRVVCAHVL